MIAYLLLVFMFAFQYLWLFDELLAALFKKEKYTLSIEYINEAKESRLYLGMSVEHDITSHTFLRYKYLTKAAATLNMMLLNTAGFFVFKFSKQEPMFLYKVKVL